MKMVSDFLWPKNELPQGDIEQKRTLMGIDPLAGQSVEYIPPAINGERIFFALEWEMVLIIQLLSSFGLY